MKRSRKAAANERKQQAIEIRVKALRKRAVGAGDAWR
jgi:hypothetical protein